MKQHLDRLIARCSLGMQGIDNETNERLDVASKTKDYLLSLASASTSLAPKPTDDAATAEAKSKALQTMRDAMDGDRQALRSLNAQRIEEVDNFIRAGSNFMRLFNVVTLGPSDEPAVKMTTGTNETRIGYLGQDGSPMSKKVEPNQAHTQIPLTYVTSDSYGYYTQDIYKGDISQVAQRTLDIAFDLGFKLDRLCYDLLTAATGSGGAFGTFTTTGAKANRTYVPHSGIVTTHLPTTNDITVYKRNGDGDFIDANGAVVASGTVITGKFGIPVLQEIIKYQNQWAGVFPDGDLVATGEILVPAIDVFDILFKLAPGTPGVTETKIQEDITSRGYTSLSYGGKNWTFVSDVTIASGSCYPIFNKKPGNVYFKPSLDAEFTDTDPKKHWEERSQQKVFGAYILAQKRMNVAKFTYK